MWGYLWWILVLSGSMNESEGDLMDKLNQYINSLVWGRIARVAVLHPTTWICTGYDFPQDDSMYWLDLLTTCSLPLKLLLLLPFIAWPHVFYLELWAMRSCDDVGKHLKNGFGKKEEGGHELVEMLSAVVPLSGCNSASLPEQHCPSGLPSSWSKSFFLIKTVLQVFFYQPFIQFLI